MINLLFLLVASVTLVVSSDSTVEDIDICQKLKPLKNMSEVLETGRGWTDEDKQFIRDAYNKFGGYNTTMDDLLKECLQAPSHKRMIEEFSTNLTIGFETLFHKMNTTFGMRSYGQALESDVNIFRNEYNKAADYDGKETALKTLLVSLDKVAAFYKRRWLVDSSTLMTKLNELKDIVIKMIHLINPAQQSEETSNWKLRTDVETLKAELFIFTGTKGFPRNPYKKFINSANNVIALLAKHTTWTIAHRGQVVMLKNEAAAFKINLNNYINLTDPMYNHIELNLKEIEGFANSLLFSIDSSSPLERLAHILELHAAIELLLRPITPVNADMRNHLTKLENIMKENQTSEQLGFHFYEQLKKWKLEYVEKIAALDEAIKPRLGELTSTVNYLLETIEMEAHSAISINEEVNGQVGKINDILKEWQKTMKKDSIKTIKENVNKILAAPRTLGTDELKTSVDKFEQELTTLASSMDITVLISSINRLKAVAKYVAENMQNVVVAEKKKKNYHV